MKELLQRLKKSTFFHFRTDPSYEAKVGSGEPPSYKQVLVGLKVFTTLHGVPQIGKASGTSKRVLWVCVFLACVCGFSYNLGTLILRYREFLVVTDIRLLHNNTLPFPAVTICNTNPVRSSQVHKNKHLVALLESWGLVVENGTVHRVKRWADQTANQWEKPGVKPSGHKNQSEEAVISRALQSPLSSELSKEKKADNLGSEERRSKRDTHDCIFGCSGEDDGIYQACDSCTQYIQCSFPDEYRITCPDGKEWNSELNECVYASPTCPASRTFCELIPPSQCVEVFYYNGETYYTCTPGPYPWCSHHTHYSGYWSYCSKHCDQLSTNVECTSNPVESCAIPFTYDGQRYHQCAHAADFPPWCSRYHDYVLGYWTLCTKTCQDRVPDPCESLSCENGGTCSVVNSSPTCVCYDSYTGDTCEKAKLGTISLVLDGLWTQDDAKTECMSRGESYRLADIESEAELQQTMANYQCASDGFSEAWVGLERISNQWTWSQDSRPAFQDNQWSKWGHSEPDNDAECGRIRYSDGGFGDRSCGIEYEAYFCEGDFVDPCSTNPCENGGTCCIINFAASCSCPDDFSGDLCEKEPSRGFTEHKDQGCSGTSVEEYSTRSARHCSWQCNLRTDCQAYVFHRRQRKCTLKIECQVETLVPAVEETTYITTGEKVTHTLFRAARGSPSYTSSPSLYDLWQGEEPLPDLEFPMDSTYQELTESPTELFKSPIVDCAWDKVQVVKASFYTGGTEVMFVLFNVSGVDKMSWFAEEYLIDSSFPTLKGSSTNYFSITGFETQDLELRRWYISHLFGGCGYDKAWAMVLDTNHNAHCTYDSFPHYPAFLYSPSGYSASSFTEAEVFVIEAQLDERDFGDSCYSTCSSLEDGLYQSCLGCDIYLTCTSQVLQYHTCQFGFLYDNSTKQCSNVSTTCSGSSAYGVCLDIPVTTLSETTTTLETADETTTALETTAIETTTDLETTVAETTTLLETTTIPETTSAETTTALLETTPVTQKLPKVTAASTHNGGLREDFIRQEQLMQVLAELDADERSQLGYGDIMLQGCVYEGQACTESDFVRIFDAVYGTCYVYNSGWSKSNTASPLLANKAGSRYGFKVIVDIGQEEYLPIIGDTAGVVVVVHKNTEMPFPEEEGVFALPGRSTDIAISMTDISRLTAPFSDCTEDVRQNLSRNVYEELYSVEYNTYACYKTCYQRNVIEYCLCADPQYPINGLAFGHDNRVCDITNSTQRECKQNVIDLYNSGGLKCDCPVPCHRQQFKYTVSSVLWPSDKKNIEELLSSKLDLFESSSLSNLVRVQVYFENFNYEWINEEPKYRLSELFTSVGGLIGLWLGCSILSIVELIELGLDFMVLSVYKCKYIPYWAHPFWKIDLTSPKLNKVQENSHTRQSCQICGKELNLLNQHSSSLCSRCEDIPASPTSIEPLFVDLAPFNSGTKQNMARHKRRSRKVKPERTRVHSKQEQSAACNQCRSYWRNT